MAFLGGGAAQLQLHQDHHHLTKLDFSGGFMGGAPPYYHRVNHDLHQDDHQDEPIISFSSNNNNNNMMHESSSSSSLPPPSYMSKETNGAYEIGELDQALFLYFDADPSSSSAPHHPPQNSSSGMKPPTLNIFPSQPMHVEPSSTTKACASMVTRSTSMDLANKPKINNDNNNNIASAAEPSKPIKREGNRKGPTSSSEQEGPKTPDPKTLRRLAQNREAARKSRLRKKAYVQQLESSRIRLAQLEQELQRARAQGILFGGGVLGGGDQNLPVGVTNIGSAVFDLEYTRWLEEHHRLTCELRAAVQEQLPENDIKVYVDNCLGHYDVIMNLKSMISKSDIFHLLSGLWKSPAERCFLWLGDFRPSHILKIIMHQIEPLSDPQLMLICGLQQSTHEAEQALSQGLEELYQSISDTVASDALSCPLNMANYMGQMAIAMNKLSTLEHFVRQADGLRQQTLHRLHQNLTPHQAARCFLAIAEYFHRLRALSSLWLARPRQD